MTRAVFHARPGIPAHLVPVAQAAWFTPPLRFRPSTRRSSRQSHGSAGSSRGRQEPARSRQNPSISTGGSLSKVWAIDRRGPGSICSFLLALLRPRKLSAAVDLCRILPGPRRSTTGQRLQNGGSATRVVAATRGVVTGRWRVAHPPSTRDGGRQNPSRGVVRTRHGGRQNP